MQKGNKKGNFKSKLPETRAFKGACYITKKVMRTKTKFGFKVRDDDLSSKQGS